MSCTANDSNMIMFGIMEELGGINGAVRNL
jgi:hypothetical protein